MECVVRESAFRLWILVLLVTGCGRDRTLEPANVMAEGSKSIKAAFASAKPDAKQSAEKIAQSIQSKNYEDAFITLRELSGVPDLSNEQREAAGRMQMALMTRLRDAAAAGDKRAADLLDFYRATK